MQSKAKDLFNYQVKIESDSSDTDTEDTRSSSGCTPLTKKSLSVSKTKKTLSLALNHELKKARKSQQEVDIQLKKRMKMIYKSLIDYVDDLGRPLIPLFMEKPSKKDYPDYYEIIDSPIDMKTIDSNIKSDRVSINSIRGSILKFVLNSILARTRYYQISS